MEETFREFAAFAEKPTRMKRNWNRAGVAILTGAVGGLLLACASRPALLPAAFPNEPAAGGPPNSSAAALVLVVSLTDSSRVLGETPLTSLPLWSENLGQLDIRLERIRSVTVSADRQSAAVVLQNGDTTRGVIRLARLTLRTHFGTVAVPWEQIHAIEVRAAGARLIEWVKLPFPRSDWPGSRGEPAKIGDGEIVLHGQGIRSKQAQTIPLTFECEFTPDRRLIPLERVSIRFIPEDTAPDDYEPAGCVHLFLQQEGTAAVGGRLYLRENGRLRDLTAAPFALGPGQPCRVRVEVNANSLRVTVNDQVAPAVAVVWPKAFQIMLDGWLPATAWHVRNISLR